MEEKILFWKFLFVMSFVPAGNYLFKVSNFNIKNLNANGIQYYGCRCRRSSVFIANCKHISNFVLIVDFAKANVCLVHIEKVNIIKDKIGHIMRYVLF